VSATATFDLAEALWNQRDRVLEASNRLLEYRRVVASPADLTEAQYHQLYAMTLDLAPDLVVELGRGYGNTTAVFTEAANAIGARVVSVSFDNERGWSTRTAPRLRELVPETWFEPLTIIEQDIMELDFRDLLGAARRVLLWWDAHGDELGRFVLAEIVPLLAERENVIAVHDVHDVRFERVERDYVRTDGWPTYWQGHLSSAFDEIVPLYDFLSRNDISWLSAAESVHDAARDGLSLADAFAALGTASPARGGGWIWFTAAGDLVYPEPPVRPPWIFSRFHPWAGEVEPGWLVNWIGVRTRTSVQMDMRGYTEPTYQESEPPTLSEEYFEWIDVLESVYESEGPFTMIELGAGWGRWLVNAAVALKQLDPARPFHLVGVEAEPTHFKWLRRHLLDNWIDPDEHTLIRAAVAERDGRVRFQRGDAADWYGQSIERDDPAAKLAGPVSRLIRWTRNTAANRVALGHSARKVRRARAVSLATVLAPLDDVDLIHVDVQGAEADVLEAAADDLARKVGRVHVGTHDPANEARVRALFERLGWECRFAFPGHSQSETPWGPVAFQDGVQSWVNPSRRPAG